jgi:hypothetical protein
MAEAGKSLDEIAPFLRETIKNMGNVLKIIACSDHTCNDNPFIYTCARYIIPWRDAEK